MALSLPVTLSSATDPLPSLSSFPTRVTFAPAALCSHANAASVSCGVKAIAHVAHLKTARQALNADQLISISWTVTGDLECNIKRVFGTHESLNAAGPHNTVCLERMIIAMFILRRALFN